jgi:DNA-binding CsgD family transcriptional regulator/PAS domain-containing protein
MQDNKNITDVIGDIYDASYKPESWPIALRGIAKHTHSSSAALLNQDSELERAGGMYVYNIPKEHIIQYGKIPGGDPNFGLLAEHVPLGDAAAVDLIFPQRDEVERLYGEEFTRFIISMDYYYYTGGAILFMDKVRSSGIGLQRKRSMGVWDKVHLNKLNTFVPHLQRAINIQREFTRLQTREQALRTGLDKLLMGLILFDKELRPIYVNPVAESILEYHPAIEIQNNKIYASDHETSVKIHSALVSASSSNNDSEISERSTAVGIKHPDCSTTLPMLISPIRGILHGFETEGSYAHVVMCFSDPERPSPIEDDKLAEVYQLTPAEAQVAISIANGLSVDEAAMMNNVAVSTIRSQLKSIYRKLGINRQTELVKVLLTGPFGQSI